MKQSKYAHYLENLKRVLFTLSLLSLAGTCIMVMASGGPVEGLARKMFCETGFLERKYVGTRLAHMVSRPMFVFSCFMSMAVKEKENSGPTPFMKL